MLKDLTKLQLWALVFNGGNHRQAIDNLKIKATGVKEVANNRLIRDGVVEGDLENISKDDIIKFIPMVIKEKYGEENSGGDNLGEDKKSKEDKKSESTDNKEPKNNDKKPKAKNTK